MCIAQVCALLTPAAAGRSGSRGCHVCYAGEGGAGGGSGAVGGGGGGTVKLTKDTVPLRKGQRDGGAAIATLYSGRSVSTANLRNLGERAKLANTPMR